MAWVHLHCALVYGGAGAFSMIVALFAVLEWRVRHNNAPLVEQKRKSWR